MSIAILRAQYKNKGLSFLVETLFRPGLDRDSAWRMFCSIGPEFTFKEWSLITNLFLKCSKLFFNDKPRMSPVTFFEKIGDEIFEEPEPQVKIKHVTHTPPIDKLIERTTNAIKAKYEQLFETSLVLESDIPDQIFDLVTNRLANNAIEDVVLKWFVGSGMKYRNTIVRDCLFFLTAITDEVYIGEETYLPSNDDNGVDTCSDLDISLKSISFIYINGRGYDLKRNGTGVFKFLKAALKLSGEVQTTISSIFLTFQAEQNKILVERQQLEDLRMKNIEIFSRNNRRIVLLDRYKACIKACINCSMIQGFRAGFLKEMGIEQNQLLRIVKATESDLEEYKIIATILLDALITTDRGRKTYEAVKKNQTNKPMVDAPTILKNIENFTDHNAFKIASLCTILQCNTPFWAVSLISKFDDNTKRIFNLQGEHKWCDLFSSEKWDIKKFPSIPDDFVIPQVSSRRTELETIVREKFPKSNVTLELVAFCL